MNVYGAGGTFSAQNGAINFNNTAGNTAVWGGNYLSQQINLNAGAGTIDFSADQVTGVLSSSGNAVHVLASTPELRLGDQHLTGDPTFLMMLATSQSTAISAPPRQSPSSPAATSQSPPTQSKPFPPKIQLTASDMT